MRVGVAGLERGLLGVDELLELLAGVGGGSLRGGLSVEAGQEQKEEEGEG